MKWDGAVFAGAKLAAFCGNGLLAYRRDDKPEILIDLPGGGREGVESPAECVLRELFEEFGVAVPVGRLHYHRRYQLGDSLSVSHFFAVHLTEDEVAAVRFGDEGQDWALMPITDFIADDDSVPRLREWLRHYLAADSTIRYLDTTSKNPGIT